MKRPFTTVVSFYIAGLLIAESFHPPLVALLIASFSVLILAFALKKFRPFLVLVLLAFAGWANLALHEAVVSPNDLRRLVGGQTELVSIRGTVARMPQVKIAARNNAEHSLTQVRVTEISGTDNWQPAFGEIIVSTPSPLANFFTGQSVEISGLIAPPAPPLAEGLFDYRDYLATRGIFYELRAASTNSWQLRQPVQSTPPLTDRFLNWSKRTLSLGLTEDETLHLLWAMTLGWRTAFTGDIGDPFLRAGTMHLFAIDGLRIALLSGMIVTLLRVLRLSRAWCGAIAIPAIWFYTAATGWESSAVRASVMMTIVLGGWALKRPWDLVNSLAAAAFLILLCEPRQLFEASFQLSFFVMLTIGLLLPELNQITDSFLQFDPLLPEQLIPAWKRVLMQAARALARYSSLSLAAWLGSIPLSALYFHLFSPISPLANLIAVPLGTFAIMANLGALICGAWLPFLTALFNNAAWFFMSAMTWVSDEFTRIPGSYWYVRSPSWISIGIFYAILFVPLSGWLKTRARQLLAVVVAVLIAVIYLWRWESLRAETAITVLPLDGGQSVFVEAGAQKNDWLIDCGNVDAMNFTLKDFLRGQGVGKIPRLALTDAESRNCGGAFSVAQIFGIRELWTSPARFRSKVYNGIVSNFEESATSQHKIFAFDGQYDCWQVFWPSPASGFSRADDGALVLLGHFPGAKILFLSDLGRLGQNGLLATTNSLRADIVVAGLPNEGEPLSDPLIAAIRPKLIVIVDSDSAFARHVTPRLKDRLADQNVPVIYTRTSGAAKIIVDKTGWKLQTGDGQQFTSAALSN